MRQHRLRRRVEFLHCYEQGRRFFSSGFVLFTAPREDAALPWRLGTAVTKKCGSAVRRNRVKRLIRESFRRHGAVPEGYDYVIVPKRGLQVRELDFAGVSAEMNRLLTAVGRAGRKPEPS